MANVKIRLFASIREHVGKDFIHYTFNENKTISDIFNDIPKLKDICFNSNGKILNNVNIFLNGEKIDSYSNINIKLNDEDELTIIPPVAGGI